MSAKYRCGECESSDRLEAIAYGYVIGPLDPDGDLHSYDVIEDFGIEEDTVQCLDHPDATVEKWIDGAWHRALPCEWADDRSRCVMGRRIFYSQDLGACPECAGRGFVEVPVAAVATAPQNQPGAPPVRSDAEETEPNKAAASSRKQPRSADRRKGRPT